jgi:spore germination protein GerM
MRRWFGAASSFVFATLLISCSTLFSGPTQVAEQPIVLYYYNPDLDKDVSGNIQCSRAGLALVKRTMPASLTDEALVRETIQRLVSGNLTPEEGAQGITTEYPLEGLQLMGVSLADGVATLAFNDPNNRTSGGACRAGILWFQIEQTALQFPEVKQVHFLPEELFQP